MFSHSYALKKAAGPCRSVRLPSETELLSQRLGGRAPQSASRLDAEGVSFGRSFVQRVCIKSPSTHTRARARQAARQAVGERGLPPHLRGHRWDLTLTQLVLAICTALPRVGEDSGLDRRGVHSATDGLWD